MRLATITLATLLAGCAGPQTVSDDVRGIEEFRDGYLAAFNRCNVEALVSYYAPEFRFISRAAPTVLTTPEQIRQYYTRTCSLDPRPTATLIEHRVIAGAGTGALDGVFVLAQAAPGSPRAMLHGTVVLRKFGDTWRIVVFHSSEVRSQTPRQGG